MSGSGLRSLGHASHCCALHGCKYGGKGCPVEAGTVRQDHLCEQCSDVLHEAPQAVSDLAKVQALEAAIRGGPVVAPHEIPRSGMSPPFPSGTPVVGFSHVMREYRGAYLAPSHTDVDGEWHLVVVDGLHPVEHGHLLLCDVQLDITHPLAVALMPDSDQVRLAAVAVALLQELDPTPEAQDLVVKHATPQEAVEQLRAMLRRAEELIAEGVSASWKPATPRGAQ